ncbi:MAG: hypothetical protein V4671_17950 [Armatimonadota bacterium]
MSFADKLRQVVAANFVEISRPDPSGSKETPKPKETAPQSPPAAAEPVEQSRLEDVVPAPEATLAEAAFTPESEAKAEEPVLFGLSGDMVTASADSALPVELEVTASVDSESEAVLSDPLALVGDDGSIAFDGVFARASVPAAASFTAEQALSLLHSMPSDLPLRVKRLTVKATLDAVGQAVGASSQHIVEDANRKISSLESFIQDYSVRSQELRSAEDLEIEQLRMRIAEREAEKAAISQREESVVTLCRSKIDKLDQVVAFFTAGDSQEATFVGAEGQNDEEETDELPAYLQEDAVKRLLGLHGNGATEPDAVGAKSPGTPARR